MFTGPLRFQQQEVKGTAKYSLRETKYAHSKGRIFLPSLATQKGNSALIYAHSQTIENAGRWEKTLLGAEVATKRHN